jgi:hypothetical protein
MNKKGFISTTIVFAFFILFISLLAFIMSSYTTNRVNNKIITNDVKKNDLKVEIKPRLLYEAILEDNGGASVITSKGNPDFDKVSVSQAYYDTLNESTTPMKSQAIVDTGMYAASDDYGTSYYFRGAVDNNWVKFAGFYWRIVRINGNNTIRIIYSGSTAPTEAQKVVMTGAGTQIGNSEYCSDMEESSDANCPKYMHGSTSSIIKTFIDNWYQNNISSYANYVSDTLFCNDINNNTSAIVYYPAWNRANKPSFVDGNISVLPITLSCSLQGDRFTVNDKITGNGKLTYPVGLLTMDELIYSGNSYCKTEGRSCDSLPNSSFYLYNQDDYYTMTPFTFVAVELSNMASEDSKGSLSTLKTVEVNDGGVRPVLNLKDNSFIMGNGTWNNPYVVQ